MTDFYASLLRHYTELVPLSRTDEERVFRCQQVRHYKRLLNQSN